MPWLARRRRVLDHTWSDRSVRAVYLNDRLVGEIGLNAALAAEYQAPVIALTGDQHAGAEAQDLLGPTLEIAAVKNATGRYAAQCLPLAEARERICEAVARAVTHLRAGQRRALYSVAAPVRLAVEFMDTQHTDRAFLCPAPSASNGTRLEFSAPDMVTAHRALRRHGRVLSARLAAAAAPRQSCKQTIGTAAWPFGSGLIGLNYGARVHLPIYTDNARYDWWPCARAARTGPKSWRASTTSRTGIPICAT